MRQILEDKLWELILEDCREHEQQILWKKPLVRFADAYHPGFRELGRIVEESHHLPQDYLPEAKTVVSWFLPFLPEVGKDNLPGSLSSSLWAEGYLRANEMAARVNEKLVRFLQRELGCEAAVPRDAGMICPDTPVSRWSQRHVAYLAGHGTFGINNMLISDAGTVGRYFSVVITLDVAPDSPVREERCPGKRNGTCGLCIRRCEAAALTEAGFDRFACLAQCLKNMALYPGADVCGKCTVELPCSYGIPMITTKE